MTLFPSFRLAFPLGLAVLFLWQAKASAVQTPYYDNFDVPPYTSNSTIVGLNGWTLTGGSASGALVQPDPTGSGRGTVLRILNGTGSSFGEVKKAIPAIATGDARVTYDI